jgi:hypothetical protein
MFVQSDGDRVSDAAHVGERLFPFVYPVSWHERQVTRFFGIQQVKDGHTRDGTQL